LSSKSKRAILLAFYSFDREVFVRGTNLTPVRPLTAVKRQDAVAFRGAQFDRAEGVNTPPICRPFRLSRTSCGERRWSRNHLRGTYWIASKLGSVGEWLASQFHGLRGKSHLPGKPNRARKAPKLPAKPPRITKKERTGPGARTIRMRFGPTLAALHRAALSLPKPLLINI